MQRSATITKKSASNLALAFVLLPKERRAGMFALYAFCREVDDIADDENQAATERAELLEGWRRDVRRACEDGRPELQVNQELQPVIRRYGLPFELFDELLKGVEMDLTIRRYGTFAALEEYCYRVASVVGLLSIRVFGYEDPGCREYAVALGKALQLTNILRDVRVDADRDRIYLPQEVLRRNGVTEEEILAHRYTSGFQAAAGEVADRAREFYQAARDSLPDKDRGAMRTAELMGAVYWRLLQKLERQRFNVFDLPLTRVAGWQKLMLIARCRMGLRQAGYGIG